MIDFETHAEMFLVLPALAITKGECTDPDCETAHWRISLGWFIWSVHLIID